MSNHAYRFTINEANEVTLVEEGDLTSAGAWRWRVETIDENETYQVVGAGVVKTETEHGKSETEVYTATDGLYFLTSTSGSDRDDTYLGGSRDDSLRGGAGNDLIHGDEGNDDLWGDVGDDHLFGDDGNDVLGAGFGNDDIIGGGAGISSAGAMDATPSAAVKGRMNYGGTSAATASAVKWMDRMI